MSKIGRPLDLIAYTTVKNLETATAGPRDGWRILRPRTILYSILIALVGGLMLWSLLNRADAQISVAPDRNPLFVVLSDGSIRNGYTIKIVNKLEVVRHFRVGVSGLADVRLRFAEFESADPVIDLAPAEVRPLKLFVTLASGAREKLKGDSMPLTINITDTDSGRSMSRVTTFSGPAR